MTQRRYPNLFTRLVAQTSVPDGQVDSTGCWIAEGKTDPRGYVLITKRVPDKPFPVNRRGHREMEQVVRGEYHEFDLDDDALGPIFMVEKPALDPDIETIDHLCYNRRCWNPDHWNIETRAENSALMQQRRKNNWSHT